MKFLVGADPVQWHTSPGPLHPRWVQAGGRGAGGASGAVLSPGKPGRGGQTPFAVQVPAAALRTGGGGGYISSQLPQQRAAPAYLKLQSPPRRSLFPHPHCLHGFLLPVTWGFLGTQESKSQPAPPNSPLLMRLLKMGGPCMQDGVCPLSPAACLHPASILSQWVLAYPSTCRASHGISRMGCCRWGPAGAAGALSGPQTLTCPEASSRP